MLLSGCQIKSKKSRKKDSSCKANIVVPKSLKMNKDHSISFTRVDSESNEFDNSLKQNLNAKGNV